LDDLLYSILDIISLTDFTPGFILDLISKYSSSALQQAICYNPNCQVRTLIRLSNSESWAVLTAIYFNRKTPFHILEKLSNSNDSIVRINLCHDLLADRQLGKLKVASIDLQFLLDSIVYK